MKAKFLFSICIMSLGLYTAAQQKADPKETEVWSPEPKIVTPGATPSDAPSDAIILFDGKNLDQWSLADDITKPAGWTLTGDGAVTVKKGTGTIQTKKTFMDYQMHIEYRIPENITVKARPVATAVSSSLRPVRAMMDMNCRYSTITITKLMSMGRPAACINKVSRWQMPVRNRANGRYMILYGQRRVSMMMVR